jgi:hypothetical protein
MFGPMLDGKWENKMQGTERGRTGGVKESWQSNVIINSAQEKLILQCQFAKPEYYTVQFGTDLRKSPNPHTFVSANIAFLNGPDRITRLAGNFIAEGYRIGQTVRVDDSTGINTGNFIILNVAATTLTIDTGGFVLTPEAPGHIVSLTWYSVNNPRASIKWSTEGGVIERVVSVLNGMTISGLGSHVSIRAELQYDPFGPVPITVLVTRGTRPAQNQPPLIQLEPIIVQAGVVGIPGINDIPGYSDIPFGQSLHIEGGAISVNAFPWADAAFNPADAEVSFRNALTGETLRSWNPFFNSEDFIPIPPNCDSLRLFNYGVVNPLYYSIVVGIDG